ncbi:PaaI family thioesterase [Salinisphaera sp.]|uniref:PaaI family thioesterase n=1 Tax=Salinisphaera sp. TaxID=1914330 RepID=UPI002D784E44|nr:PaaI family thioesterase [Salinisphaera sp.]HET7314604.1 PaaI family thioesterase [Salinisphaera sp.]
MTDSIDKSDPVVRGKIAQRFTDAIPHNRAIGLTLISAGPPDVHTRLAYREDFLGNVKAGLWHTAIATTAADSSCGLAVFLAMPGMEAVATLDLRMDYLRPAVAGRDLEIVASCHHVTRNVAFATAMLHQGDSGRPTARCTATFMRTGGSVLP